MKPEYHILNLGAGLQSTVLYMLACPPPNPTSLPMLASGPAAPSVPKYDAAIFADTKAEPKAVIAHVKWLKTLRGPAIYVDSKGNLETDLIEGTNSLGRGKIGGNRFASIPCFTAPPVEERGPKWREGRVKRQCTKEYKTDVVQWVIRRRILGMGYRQRFPKNVHIHQYFGFSAEELGRMKRLQDRFKDTIPWATPHFPLIEAGWTRKDCRNWLATKVPHRVHRSACVFCPYKDDVEWAEMKANQPEEWARAVAIDRALRADGSQPNRQMTNPLWLHRSCIPLEEVDFSKPVPAMLSLFNEECEGMCGN